jgi:ankyrin repeat protein
MNKIVIQSACMFLLTLMCMTGCHRNDSRHGSGEMDAAESPVSSKELPAQNPASRQLSQEALAVAGESLRQAALDGMAPQVKELLDSGVDPDASDQDGVTPLMLSAFNGHSVIVLELLARGVMVDGKDRLGRTALLYAATGPFPETVKILLDKGADPNIVDAGEHFTPLMHAAAEGNMEVVRILLQSGADPSLTDLDNDDAEAFARQAGHVEVAELLHDHRK